MVFFGGGFCHSYVEKYQARFRIYWQKVLHKDSGLENLSILQKEKREKKTIYIRHNDTTKDKIYRQFQHIGIWIPFELQS